jgi:hypothetical protein
MKSAQLPLSKYFYCDASNTDYRSNPLYCALVLLMYVWHVAVTDGCAGV